MVLTYLGVANVRIRGKVTEVLSSLRRVVNSGAENVRVWPSQKCMHYKFHIHVFSSVQIIQWYQQVPQLLRFLHITQRLTNLNLLPLCDVPIEPTLPVPLVAFVQTGPESLRRLEY
jgi:hypothetical protein